MLREWDTTNANDAALANAGDYRPNWMGIYGERLCLYGVYNNNSSTNYPRRIRWCVAGDATDWSGTGSGAKDLRTELTSGDEIMRAEPLGNSMFIYGARSIAVQGYRADADSPFPTDAMSDEIGLAASDALYLFHRNFYSANDIVQTFHVNFLRKSLSNLLFFIRRNS